MWSVSTLFSKALLLGSQKVPLSVLRVFVAKALCILLDSILKLIMPTTDNWSVGVGTNIYWDNLLKGHHHNTTCFGLNLNIHIFRFRFYIY